MHNSIRNGIRDTHYSRNNWDTQEVIQQQRGSAGLGAGLGTPTIQPCALAEIMGVEMDASFTYGVTLRQTGSTTNRSQRRRRPSQHPQHGPGSPKGTDSANGKCR
jgi:hypothetical protein